MACIYLSMLGLKWIHFNERGPNYPILSKYQKGKCIMFLLGLILGLHPANEGRRYKVTPSLTRWAQT